MVLIPYGMAYSSTMRAATLKFVGCEKCATEYVYQLERTAVGEGSSFLFVDNEGAASRATSRARSVLEQKLERGVDLVPCPACGWYQANMVPKARKLHHRWMFKTGLCLVVGLIPVAALGGVINSGLQRTDGLPWPIFIGVLAPLFALGIGLIAVKFALARKYDPNYLDVESRIRLGRSRAMLREDLEKQVKAQEANQRAQENVVVSKHLRSLAITTQVSDLPVEFGLRATEGSNAGELFPLERRRMSVGKSRSADIRIDDPSAARQHFAIAWSDETKSHWLEVWQGPDAVGYNGRQLEGDNRCELKHGDRIQLGVSEFVYARN